MAIQDARAGVDEVASQRTAAGGAVASACCGTDEQSTGGAPGICPETHEPCPTPLTAAEVLATFRAEADAWSVDRDGDAVHGRTFGAGPPLYLLNGVVGTHELYALLAWVLREHFRCVLFDWPAGRSARRGKEPAIVPFVEDLIRVADFHGDDQFAVYGPSFGGQVALAALHAHPQRIDRAALHGAFASRRLSVFERSLVWVGGRLPGRVGKLPLFESILRQNHLLWFPPFDAARFRFLADNAGQTPLRAAAARGDALRRTDVMSRLGEIRQPVLLVRTEGEGPVSARGQEAIAAALPNASSVWLHSSGQLPHLTHPHRLAGLLRSFLLDEIEEL